MVKAPEQFDSGFAYWRQSAHTKTEATQHVQKSGCDATHADVSFRPGGAALLWKSVREAGASGVSSALQHAHTTLPVNYRAISNSRISYRRCHERSCSHVSTPTLHSVFKHALVSGQVTAISKGAGGQCERW